MFDFNKLFKKNIILVFLRGAATQLGFFSVLEENKNVYKYRSDKLF